MSGLNRKIEKLLVRLLFPA
ncbi:BgTH12-01011 [Blumeria graminis f. sp. triticale]|uniref:BgTH12-01011 n=1 Tax=Blumeria graminis f. sp. triticale TaxID=1689686 RepID=A0A9W4GHV2_BLUGR|nr:BgTH12-01011 [Blumeria graminis f. sp. triticale]